MSPIEAMAWAILKFEGFRPGTLSWRNRNPGNLRPRQDQPAKDGYRYFPSFAVGWEALLSDVHAKFRGAPYTRTGLGPTSTLLDFFEVYAPAADKNRPIGYAQFVADSLTESLGREITTGTTLQEIEG